jgi:hypothetical protein
MLFHDFLGNTIRGILGNALIRHYCLHEDFDRNNEAPPCEQCPYNGSIPMYSTGCVYADCFKSIHKSVRMPSVPNPFVIKVGYGHPRLYEKGESIRFSILLFGKAVEWTDDVTRCMEDAVLLKHPLVTIRQESTQELLWSDTFDSSKPTTAQVKSNSKDHSVDNVKSHISEHYRNDQLDLNFRTPLQIWKGKRLVKYPEFNVFMDTLFARIAALIDVYETEPFTLPYDLLIRKPHVHLELAEDTWHKVQIRQAMQTFQGYCGKLRYSGDLRAYIPYLRLGELIHVGKLTTRGFGEYQLA